MKIERPGFESRVRLGAPAVFGAAGFAADLDARGFDADFADGTDLSSTGRGVLSERGAD